MSTSTQLSRTEDSPYCNVIGNRFGGAGVSAAAVCFMFLVGAAIVLLATVVGHIKDPGLLSVIFGVAPVPCVLAGLLSFKLRYVCIAIAPLAVYYLGIWAVFQPVASNGGAG